MASCFAAGLTALSACAALIARERDGGLGQRIEIPLSDALLEASGIITTPAEKQAPMRGGAFAPGLHRSRDDQVLCFTSGVHRHLLGLARISGNALRLGLLVSAAVAVMAAVAALSVRDADAASTIVRHRREPSTARGASRNIWLPQAVVIYK